MAKIKNRKKNIRKQLWYYARVKNNSGMHTVFYASTKPIVGATCNGIAHPNRIIGYWCEPSSFQNTSDNTLNKKD